MAAVKAEDIKKTYSRPSWRFWEDRDTTEALKGVSFEVEESEVFGIVGPNGAGKTTLINILTGLLYRDSGTLEIFGEDIEKKRSALAHRMNVATAYSRMSGNLTVRENLNVFARIYDVENRSEKIDEVLEIFQISELEGKKIHHLSAGQKTRANLAKSFVNEPELLLLDEATAGLDPQIAQVTRDAIKQLKKDLGTTILVTSHRMEDIDQLSDRMMFLHRGEVLETGTPAELKKKIHSKVIQVTVAEVTDEFRGLVESEGGFIRENTATIKVDTEQQIVEFMAALNDLDVQVTDVEARNPDLDQVFRKVAER